MVMEERLRKLLTGAMEEVLPLISVQELEEELNREPEAVGGESWKKWEQIVLTRLLFRMAEVVALQNLRQECRSTEDGKQQLKSGSDKGKRKQEGDEVGGGKRQKKDLQESEVVPFTTLFTWTIVVIDHASYSCDIQEMRCLQLFTTLFT